MDLRRVSQESRCNHNCFSQPRIQWTALLATPWSWRLVEFTVYANVEWPHVQIGKEMIMPARKTHIWRQSLSLKCRFRKYWKILFPDDYTATQAQNALSIRDLHSNEELSMRWNQAWVLFAAFTRNPRSSWSWSLVELFNKGLNNLMEGRNEWKTGSYLPQVICLLNVIAILSHKALSFFQLAPSQSRKNSTSKAFPTAVSASYLGPEVLPRQTQASHFPRVPINPFH